MQCPKCGSTTHVDSTAGTMGIVNRKRKCNSLICRLEFSTVEIVNSPPEYSTVTMNVDTAGLAARESEVVEPDRGS